MPLFASVQQIRTLYFLSLSKFLQNFLSSACFLIGQYPGLCGLFVSGIFSASLSAVSSAVSSLVAVEDYIKLIYDLWFKRPMIETNTTLSSKSMAFIYGIVCVALAFGAGSLGGVLQASLTIFGVVGGPLLAIFTLGMFTVKANQRGVLLSLIIGLFFSFKIGFGGPKLLQ
uniref:Sodium-dependent multivitamin transporter n=1 Tax=Glossina pallidipes TaxID=7398 RepID=A0A1A9ZH93_GLOPL